MNFLDLFVPGMYKSTMFLNYSAMDLNFKRRTACIKHTCPMKTPISVSINTFAQENRIVIGPGFSPKSVTCLTVLITIGIGTWQNMNVQSICEIVHVIVQKTVNKVGGHCWGNPFSIRPFTDCILNHFFRELEKEAYKI